MDPSNNRKLPLHERIAILGWARRPVRRALFSFLGKLAQTDDAKALAAGALKGLLPSRPECLNGGQAAQVPYPELGGVVRQAETCRRKDIVFITARFRTGSTLLWNLFRQAEGVTAYYEPLNERRWFDPACRGDRMDPTHRKVTDYWKEYEGLEGLGAYYRESWIDHDLLMGPDFWAPELKHYVEALVEKARGRPVLQFNRIDFRLPWFRKHFPGATLVHLYRHPRDQWCSCFPGGRYYPPDAGVAGFAEHDHFYLLNWARDLRYHFPFLDEPAAAHPYQLFYYLWKLSYLFGRQYAHYSLAYEHLVDEPAAEIRKLLSAVGIDAGQADRLAGLVDKPAPQGWKRYADDAWFKRHESHCERVLEEFLGEGD